MPLESFQVLRNTYLMSPGSSQALRTFMGRALNAYQEEWPITAVRSIGSHTVQREFRVSANQGVEQCPPFALIFFPCLFVTHMLVNYIIYAYKKRSILSIGETPGGESHE
jgi:hypothetical protein